MSDSSGTERREPHRSTLSRGMVRIVGKQGITVGAGFVASKQYIVTCAHVVESAGSRPGANVEIGFLAREPQPGEPQTTLSRPRETFFAKVRSDLYRSFKDGDIAILEIADPLPSGVAPVPLGTTVRADHDMQTIGFPNLAAFGYFPAHGRILELVPEGRRWCFPVETSQAVEGFSGAPVFDTSQRLVVGMLSTKLVPPMTRSAQMQHLTMAIPVTEIFSVCSDLQPSEQCPYRGLDTFSESDGAAFFGRDRAIEQLMSALTNFPELLFVLGPSGSGKSSLLRAGVVPKLQSELLNGRLAWEYFRYTPSDIS